MIARPWLLALAVGCMIAAVLVGPGGTPVWIGPPGASRPRLADSVTGSDAVDLARGAFQKDLHAAVLYGVLAVGLAFAAFSTAAWLSLPLLALVVPVIASIRFAPRFLAEARLAESSATARAPGRGGPGPGGAGAPALGRPPGPR